MAAEISAFAELSAKRQPYPKEATVSAVIVLPTVANEPRKFIATRLDSKFRAVTDSVDSFRDQLLLPRHRYTAATDTKISSTVQNREP